MIALDVDARFMFARLGAIIRRLHLDSNVRGAAERLCKPDRHIRRDAGFVVYDVIERLPGDAEDFSALRDGKTQRFQAFKSDNTAGMRGALHRHADAA